jgi:hypothetical protein
MSLRLGMAVIRDSRFYTGAVLRCVSYGLMNRSSLDSAPNNTQELHILAVGLAGIAVPGH